MQNKNLEYQIFRKNLTSGEMAIVSCEIDNSEEFEFGEFSHIVLNGTNIKVGYIGNETFELINPNKKEFRKYHNKLKEIFNYTLHNQH